MADELSLAERFLSIEQVRFGARLQVERHIDESALECQVPPLVLQPLLENAVAHGIAGLVDGGTIRLDVVRRGDRLSIAVENPRDPDAAAADSAAASGSRTFANAWPSCSAAPRAWTRSPSPDRIPGRLDLPCAVDD